MGTISLARYSQSSREFAIFAPIDETPNERVVFDTTATGAGNNNPADQHRRNLGPLPVGLYWVRLEASPKFRAPAFRLHPYPGNAMHGRSGFWIHGGTRSEGCILLPPAAREAVSRFRVRVLEVVP